MAIHGVQQHPRYRTSILVRVLDPSTSQMAVRSLANISKGGVFVCTPEILPVGTTLQLILHPPGNPLGVKGRIIHALDKEQAAKKAHPVGFGLQFDTVDDGIAAALDKFMQTLPPSVRNPPVSPPASFSTDAAPARPFRATPRFIDRTQVRLTIAERGDLKDLWLSNLSKGGLFVETPSPPPQGTRVSVELDTPGGKLTLAAEVVHVVDEKSAAQLGMAAGAGLQFVGLGKGEREALHAYVEGRAPKLEVQTELVVHTANATTVMGIVTAFFASVEKEDLFGALQLRKDAGEADINARIEQLRVMFSTPPADASPAQSARIAAAARTLQKVEQAIRRPSTKPSPSTVARPAAPASVRSSVDPELAAKIQKHLVAARNHEAAQEYAAARESLLKLQEIAPSHPGLIDRITSLKEKADVQDAAAALDLGDEEAEKPDNAAAVMRCVRKAQELSQARHILVRCMHLLMRIRFHDDAELLAQQITRKYADEQGAWAVLMHIHEKASNWKAALEAGEELLLLRPKDNDLRDQVDEIRKKARRR